MKLFKVTKNIKLAHLKQLFFDMRNIQNDEKFIYYTYKYESVLN